MMSPLAWAACLLAFGLLIVIIEMFVPSGGVLAFIAAVSVIASIVTAFRHSSTAGLGFMTIAVFGTPILLAIGFKLWPSTPLGKRILLDVPTGDDAVPDADLRKQRHVLIGKFGTAKAEMLPGGPVLVDGRIYDAVSEGDAVDDGTHVKVVDVRGTRLVVRPTKEELPPVGDPNDPLNRPIESLGLDPFEGPLG
ncbi:MAG: hypothetical protein K8U03_10765 [Planctomycetia bacterium]|nr:hypothetical protein [Planctomycetia bacterium]